MSRLSVRIMKGRKYIVLMDGYTHALMKLSSFDDCMIEQNCICICYAQFLLDL